MMIERVTTDDGGVATFVEGCVRSDGELRALAPDWAVAQVLGANVHAPSFEEELAALFEGEDAS